MKNMDKGKLTSVNIDYQGGCKRFAGNSELYEKFLKRFSSDQTFNQAMQAFEKKDAEALYNAIHTLKGVSGNLSIMTLYGLCSRFCEEYKEGNTDNLENIFKEVASEQEKVIAALKE